MARVAHTEFGIFTSDTARARHSTFEVFNVPVIGSGHAVHTSFEVATVPTVAQRRAVHTAFEVNTVASTGLQAVLSGPSTAEPTDRVVLSLQGSLGAAATYDITQVSGPTYVAETSNGQVTRAFRTPVVEPVEEQPLLVPPYTTNPIWAVFRGVVTDGQGGTSTITWRIQTYPHTLWGSDGAGVKTPYLWIASDPTPAPLPSFAATPTAGDAPITVRFTDTSVAAANGTAPTSWLWDFGDGQTSPLQNPSHVYSIAGTYAASLRVASATSPLSTARTQVITASVPAAPAPTASFSQQGSGAATAPYTVTFIDTSTSTPTSWLWEFGDSTTSTLQNPTHIYQAAGTYTVKLTSKNSSGQSTVTGAPFTVAGASVPQAAFTTSSTGGPAPITIAFTDTTTGTVASRVWTFGDGTTSTALNPTKTYGSPGNWLVVLETYNARGDSTTASAYINVTSASASVFPADDDLPVPAAHFTNPFTLDPAAGAFPEGSFIRTAPGQPMTGAAAATFDSKMVLYADGTPDTAGVAVYNHKTTLSTVAAAGGVPAHFRVHTRAINGVPQAAAYYPRTPNPYKVGGAYWSRVQADAVVGYGYADVLIPQSGTYGTRSDGVARKWYEWDCEDDPSEQAFTSTEQSGSWHPNTGDFGPHTIVHYRSKDASRQEAGGIEEHVAWYVGIPAQGIPACILRHWRRPGGQWRLLSRHFVGVSDKPKRMNFQSGWHSSAIDPSQSGDGYLRDFGRKEWELVGGSRPAPTKEVRFPDDMGWITGNQTTVGADHTRGLRFRVDEAGAFSAGVMWFAPAGQDVTVQLFRVSDGALLASRAVTGLANGWYPIYWDTKVALTQGAEYQVQTAMTAANAKHTAQAGRTDPTGVNIGPVVMAAQPYRFGSSLTAMGTGTGAAWAGIGAIVECATAVQYPPGSEVPPETTVQTYLTRSGTKLYLDGKEWRGGGVNWHWVALRETNLQYPTHAMIDEILDECVVLGVKFVRAHTLGMSAGLPQSLVTSINTDGTLVWNAAAWEPIDYAIAQAKARGIRFIVPFTDQFDYYHKGKGWWVSQAFIRRATSGIPSTYTYGSTTETGVTSFDPSVGTVANSPRYKIISQQFYRNTWIRATFNSYVSQWFDHVNQYTGIALKNEPTIAFAQYGNELWDSGDKYPDHAGADGISALAQFAATVKSKQPKVLVVDGIGADGIDPDFAPGRNLTDVDIIDAQHAYNGQQTIGSGYVAGFANKVAAFNKVAFFGEYPTANAGVGTFLAEIEQTAGVMGAAFWAIYSSSEGHNSNGYVDDTTYFVGGGGSNPNWKAIFQAHAAIMSGGTIPPAPVLTNLMKSAAVANCEAAASAYSTGAASGTAPTRSIVAGAGSGGSGSALGVTVADVGYKWVYPNSPTTAGAPVTPGNQYTASGNARIVSGTLGSGWYGHLTWYKADGTYISGGTSSGTVTASGTDVQVTFTGTAPALAAYAIPQIEFQANGAAELRMDRWGVFAGTSATPWAPPA